VLGLASGWRKGEDRFNEALECDGGVGPACKDGSVMDPRRWFCRYSSGAKGVTGEWRGPAIDEEEGVFLGEESPSILVAFGDWGCALDEVPWAASLSMSPGNC